ncbi:hypothetical protein P3T76_011027 [Phytophthora citrophthora]|uniref:RRM domain-containing protein n=1 Tax=Phytophthora citrophthora TaxID=4793 RepID=A0AAD9LF78_9STRA|nr:hypothetical protein P3T76_011027 [Phytophthora citrophthora]
MYQEFPSQATHTHPSMAEDMLTELYAWDSEIEDVSALAANDPKRDEDKAEDAYERIIHAATGADASDVVLSLAAQLLHKHFFSFPHVQLNVVDVLLKLCGPKRSQSVRIHTLRALLQIVKTPPAAAAASTPTSAASIARKNTRMWLQRIDEAVQNLLETEPSSVILRQVTPLRNALEERLQPELDLSQSKPSSHVTDNEQSSNQASPSERSRKKLRDETDRTGGDDVYAPSEREPKKAKLDDSNKEGKIVVLNRDSSSSAPKRGLEEPSSWKKQPQVSNGRTVEAEGRRQKISVFSPRNCPPCPYLFLGSVPRHTPSGDIVEFLTPVWPEIDYMSVQIKQPDHNATAYAFVSMPSIEHAREAILYVNANKFRGRVFLNANFARGPPVDTVLFVQRTGEDVSMEDKDAVREFDFNKFDPEVWDGMCQQLERFGPLSFAEKGCVRFCNVEHAKQAIRKQVFNVKGHEIFPVYDTKEQFAIDSTRRGSNVQNKQGFALKSGRLVGGDTDYHSGKKRHYREDDDSMDDSNGRRDHDRVKYGQRGSTRSPPRNDRDDRGSARGRSHSRSPKTHSATNRYDDPMTGPPRERRASRSTLTHSRSRSPITLVKQVLKHEGGYGTASDKENRRDFRSKYGHRSPSPVDVRSRESSVLVEEVRGRPRERPSRWMERPMERREPRDEERGRESFHRGSSPSPSLSSRRSRKDDSGNQRLSDYRREGGRHSYQREEESMREERDSMRSAPPGGLLQLPRSRSRSPPRFGKYGGSSKNRRRSRSRSPHEGARMRSSSNHRSSGYRDREERLVGNPLPEERAERPRYTDERSIAEVARDEQQERQRFFQNQQGRRDSHDADLSRYGGGRGGRGGGRGRSDRYHAQQSYRGDRGGMYREELPPQRRSSSPLPPPGHHRSTSPPMGRRRSPSPLPPPQQRESYSRERRREFSSRGRESTYSPPPSPLAQGTYGPGSAGPPDRNEFDPTGVENRGDRHDRRHHSRRESNRDDKNRRSHREHREKRSSRLDRSQTPSPDHREHPSSSNGRKSNGPSPRRSFSRRNESDNQAEEASGKDKQPRPVNEDDSESQKKEIKSGGARMARDELFAGMDDLTVDYEEDDE